ncbi:BON domain-containing protein [Flavobacterium album]|nr:BON domain-containing protein [Flavobacterium album]
MKTDETIQLDVERSLYFQPEVDDIPIAVAVEDGVVILTGKVEQYSQKEAAQSAARHVSGVRGIVNHIIVAPNGPMVLTDAEIEKAIHQAYQWRWEIPWKQLRIRVSDGYVTLEGEVGRNFQREAAREAASQLLGVKGVNNKITVRTQPDHKADARDVEGALFRNRDIDDDDITVEALGNTIILRGSVPSLAQKEAAEKMAWNASGAEHVQNLLEVL